jgi:hypothetical protein
VQTVNGRPAIVLSDLVVKNTRIMGHISVETTADDDLIGFVWGWQSPLKHYLLSWKQATQNWTANCGNALAGIAVKKVDLAGTDTGTTLVSGFKNTDHTFSCALTWATDRAYASLEQPGTSYFTSPADATGFKTGWADAITYRFEFYHTLTRTKILIYQDELKNGSTALPVTSLVIEDASFPEGQFAFFSNSQEQVNFGDFVLASLDAFAAQAGNDRSISAGASTTLAGTANLAVPPYTCEWFVNSTRISTSCNTTVNPSSTTTYSLVVTDDAKRSQMDDVTVFVQ